MEDYSFENAETRYIIQTSDKRELNLYLNANKMACVLYDLISWHNSIYNGKNYGEVNYLYDGILYSENEWFNKYNEIIKEEDKDKHGIVLSGKVKKIYLEDDLLNILKDKLDNIWDFVNNYIE